MSFPCTEPIDIWATRGKNNSIVGTPDLYPSYICQFSCSTDIPGIGQLIWWGPPCLCHSKIMSYGKLCHNGLKPFPTPITARQPREGKNSLDGWTPVLSLVWVKSGTNPHVLTSPSLPFLLSVMHCPDPPFAGWLAGTVSLDCSGLKAHPVHFRRPEYLFFDLVPAGFVILLSEGNYISHFQVLGECLTVNHHGLSTLRSLIFMDSHWVWARRDLNNHLIQPSCFIDKVTEGQRKNDR